jgi:putative flippase GtrA
MASAITWTINYLRQNDLSTILKKLNSRDTHPVIQFIKYGICGVSALVLHIVLYSLLVWKFWPHLADPAMDPWRKALDSFAPTGLVLIATNTLVYFLNTRWVFTPGRHSPVVEFVLFTLVNIPGAVAGALGQAALIRFLNWHPLLAMLGFLIPNILINYVCRKFIIFKK